MRGNESFTFILPMSSLNGGLRSAVQRERAIPAFFTASFLHHDFSTARVSHLKVLNSQWSQARTSWAPCSFHSHNGRTGEYCCGERAHSDR